MNVQSLSRFTPMFLVAIALLSLAGASGIAISHSASARYRECSNLAASNPALALEKAKAWRISNASSPIARHCEALALYGMKNYAEAADVLLSLSKEAAAENPILSEDLLLQAVKAYKTAEQYDTAIDAISDRLVQPESQLPQESKAELLTERARLYLDLKHPFKAAQDLNQALMLAPKNLAAKSLLTEIYKENSRNSVTQ
jgi:tetratricopeptide (TPR) repeat protein